jgi:hypothetical protein
VRFASADAAGAAAGAAAAEAVHDTLLIREFLDTNEDCSFANLSFSDGGGDGGGDGGDDGGGSGGGDGGAGGLSNARLPRPCARLLETYISSLKERLALNVAAGHDLFARGMS